MRDELFRLLKQEFSPLGLGDEILMARAEMLDSLGFVTSENVNDVVSKQKASLVTMQKANDLRVTNALKKAADDARKKAEEDAKKAEVEAKKKAEEDARRLAEEEAKKKAEEIREKGGLSSELKAFLEEQDKRRSETFRSMMEEQKKAQDATIAELSKSLKVMQDENAKMKEERLRVDRQNMILNKAKELGIPQSRIDEGFVIADDADEASIASYLGNVKKNIDANKLPSNEFFRMGDNTPTKEEIGGMADALLGIN